ncbi:MAG: hypothetical protein QOC81_4610 [Thermoanaerobaculia bacterium]|jgi:hypothetical protein|nr:hypothetical protein [Thermoanaerobaculia bacterium]
MQRPSLFAALLLCIAGAAFSQPMPSWMAGTWTTEHEDVRMEEHWSRGDGLLMVGMHQDVARDGRKSFEFLRIERRDGNLVYLAMPRARPETPFPVKSATATRIVFENPDHDFPQRIIYWRDGAKLCARTEGTIKGKAESEEWCWSRMEP